MTEEENKGTEGGVVKAKRKPYGNKFSQQQLRAWQPNLRPQYVIVGLYLIAALFIALGIALIFATKSVIEVKVTYSGSKDETLCTMTRRDELGGAPYCRDTMEIVIPKTMKPPIYMYYGLERFFQNHRKYIGSRKDNQFHGAGRVSYASTSVCDPFRSYGGSKSVTMVYSPCGKVAYSMFNDTFILSKQDVNNTIVCDTVEELGCSKKGIAWPVDVKRVFTKPKNETVTNWRYPNTYYNESTHVIPQIDDEDFMVWMRTATLSKFFKLHRIIRSTIPNGTYNLEITQNFPVSEFNGKKLIMLTTKSWMGGKNLFFAIAYTVVGGICFVLATLLVCLSVVKLVRAPIMSQLKKEDLKLLNSSLPKDMEEEEASHFHVRN